MKLIRNIGFFVILIILTACSASTYISQGNQLKKQGKTFEACQKYEIAYKKIKNNREKRLAMAEQIGDNYKDIANYRKALRWYKKSTYSRKPNMQRVYKLLEVAHISGNKAEIDRTCEKYNLEYNPQTKTENKVRYIVENANVFNSRYDDFCPILIGDDSDKLYITSNRNLKSVFKQYKSKVSGTNKSDIYLSKYSDEVVKVFHSKNKKTRRVKKEYIDSLRWQQPLYIRDSIINTASEEGAICFSSDEKNIYFTSSRKEEGLHLPAKIFIGTKQEDDLFSDISRLKITNDSIPIGQPAISPNGTRLYFVSRMKGGKGGADIWYSIKMKGKWSEPVNASEINTQGDDMYPSFNSEGDLFFASNGREGFGGFDIYKRIEKNNKIIIEHLPEPINSYADDFAITYYKGQDKGFFSSNRGEGDDLDIYYFAYSPLSFSMKIVVVDNQTSELIPRTTVRMIDSNGEFSEKKTDIKGEVSFDWINKSEVSFFVYKKGYLKDKISFSTFDLKDNMSYSELVRLNNINATIEIPDIFFEFGKYNLSEKSITALNKLVNLLKINNDISIELSSHSDMIGDDQSNLLLSQKRAQSIVDFLISKGIRKDRLKPKGYGEKKPRIITKSIILKYPFLKNIKSLSPVIINSLDKNKQEICNALNRRTEFIVISK